MNELNRRIKFPKDTESYYDPVEILLLNSATALFLGYRCEIGGDAYTECWFYFNPQTGEKTK